ncbi:MAG: FmdE family protein [Desulfobacterota bacterium]|nr:FmdE family protein [Thermodesulfobacteriota bacterium]MDW8002576.1 FmdE family protein [Deltaproteobacteria bacterium]
MKRVLLKNLILILFVFSSGLSLAGDLKLPSLFEEAKKSIGRIDYVITNVGYTSGSLAYLDGLVRVIENHKISLKNVQYVHSDFSKPLFFAFINRDSGNLFYYDSLGKRGLYSVAFDDIVKQAHEWQKRITERVFSGFEFSILTISQMLMRNAPYELMKAAELHNHVCPGLWTGYFISKFITKSISPDEELTIFAIPPSCKDDALQTMLDKTVGKRNLYSRELTEEEKKLYPDLAGVYVFWDKKKETMRAVFLKYPLGELRKAAGIDEKEYPWLWRMKLNEWIVKNLSTAEKAVEIIKEVPIDKKKLDELKMMKISLKDL